MLACGGVSGVIGAFLMLNEAISGYGLYEGADENSLTVIVVSSALTALFVSAGLPGVWALLGDASPRMKKLAGAGLLLAGASWVLFGFLMLHSVLFPPYYGDPHDGPSTIEEVFSAVSILSVHVGPAGVVLLGVAALRARGLGGFRWLPLGVGVMLTPLPETVLSYFFRPKPLEYVHVNDVLVSRTMLFDAVVPMLPDFIAALGCVLLGVVLFGARDREAKLDARGRRLTEERNLALANRLYKEAWGAGSLKAVDELVSPEVEDRYHEERGRESFRRNVAALRRTFPDIAFAVEEQRAEGDEVTTRWTMEGTDEGGVLWYPPTGRRGALSGSFTDRFSGGRLVEHRGEADVADLLKQLGLPRVGERETSS